MRAPRSHLFLIGGNLIVVGLLVLLALDMAGVDWRRGKENPTGASKAPPVSDEPKPTPLSERPPLTDFSRLNTSDIFGTDPDRPTPKEPTPAPVLEETRLNLRLKGTVVGEDLSSYAMIVDGRTRFEEVYRVDEYVQGARIVSIQKEGVILQGAKGREFLRMPQPGEGGPRASRASHRAQRKRTPRPRKQQ
jgi:type II secretory pathway component PulC